MFSQSKHLYISMLPQQFSNMINEEAFLIFASGAVVSFLIMSLAIWILICHLHIFSTNEEVFNDSVHKPCDEDDKTESSDDVTLYFDEDDESEEIV